MGFRAVGKRDSIVSFPDFVGHVFHEFAPEDTPLLGSVDGSPRSRFADGLRQDDEGADSKHDVFLEDAAPEPKFRISIENVKKKALELELSRHRLPRKDMARCLSLLANFLTRRPYV
jgi:hypothetical protein